MLEIGTVFASQYRVDKLVGVGGMGLVYQALDLETQTRVAIKVMRRAMLESTADIQRFGREARALAKLNHTNIVRVFDAGALDGGVPYMVMELLIGKDLRSELRERGPLPFGEVAGYMLQACDAVAAAHERGIIHRDLKPQNLFVTNLASTREIKLLDFGISKLLNDGECSVSVSATATSMMLGTPHYMSPEQVRAHRDIDLRTDIWSLGVVMYFLTTGRLPFTHSSPTAVIAAIPTETPKPPTTLRSEMPEQLERIILKCLQKDRRERYQSARDLARDLEQCALASRDVQVRGAIGLKSLPPLPMPKADALDDEPSRKDTAPAPYAAAAATVQHRRSKPAPICSEAVHEADTLRAPHTTSQLLVQVAEMEPRVAQIVATPSLWSLLTRHPQWMTAIGAASLLLVSTWAAGRAAAEPIVTRLPDRAVEAPPDVESELLPTIANEKVASADAGVVVIAAIDIEATPSAQAATARPDEAVSEASKVSEARARRSAARVARRSRSATQSMHASVDAHGPSHL